MAVSHELGEPLLKHLRTENETIGGVTGGRDAIEMWANAAEAEFEEFAWERPDKIKKVDDALAWFRASDAGTLAEKPATLAWHDRTTVILPVSGKEEEIKLEYTPDPREENRLARMRSQHGNSAQRVETIFEWRGYFGADSLIVDGWNTMRQRGRSWITSLRARAGHIVGTVLRRLSEAELPPLNDPAAKERLIRMSGRYANIARDCPDLASIDPLDAEHVIVFVHGFLSCGIHGLKDLLVNPGTFGAPIFRFEHDTFHRIADNAEALANLIRAKISTRNLLLLAHSRGGLVARMAADKLRGNYGARTSVHTFGTPHKGTPVADVGGKAVNLLFKLGEDIITGIPFAGPFAKGLTYVYDSPQAPEGLSVMRTRSETLEALSGCDPANVKCWGSACNVNSARPVFSVEIDGALLAILDGQKHDLVVPLASSLGFGAAQAPLTCSHLDYFSEKGVRTAVTSFFSPPSVPAPAPAAPGPLRLGSIEIDGVIAPPPAASAPSQPPMFETAPRRDGAGVSVTPAPGPAKELKKGRIPEVMR